MIFELKKYFQVLKQVELFSSNKNINAMLTNNKIF